MKLKSKLLLAMGLTLSVGLAACSDKENTENKTEVTDTSTDENTGEYKGIKESEAVTYTLPVDILEKFNNKETFAFVVGNEQCSACNNYKENGLKEYASIRSEKLMFVETFNLENDTTQADALVEVIEKHLDNKFEATPTTYFIVNGKLKKDIVGSISYGKLSEAYDKYIK